MNEIVDTGCQGRQARRERAWVSLYAIALIAVSLFCNIVGVGGGVRAALSVVFFMTVPGLPLGLRFIADRALTVVVVVGASISITILISVVMVTTHIWHPLVAQVVVAAATVPTFMRTASPLRIGRGR